MSLLSSNAVSARSPTFATGRGAVGVVVVMVTSHMASVSTSPACSMCTDVLTRSNLCESGTDCVASVCAARTGSFVGS